MATPRQRNMTAKDKVIKLHPKAVCTTSHGHPEFKYMVLLNNVPYNYGFGGHSPIGAWSNTIKSLNNYGSN